MDEILKQIYENRTWLFSGLGIFLFSGVIWLFKKIKKKNKQSKKQINLGGNVNNSIINIGDNDVIIKD